MGTADDVLKRIVNVRGGTLAEFKERNNSDPRVVRNRLLAVILLFNYWEEREGEEADELVISKLNCSPEFMTRAETLVETDEEFAKQLHEIDGEAFPAPEPAAEVTQTNPVKKPDKVVDPPGPSPEVLKFVNAVTEICEITPAELESAESGPHHRHLVRARDVLFLILNKHLGLTQEETGAVLGRTSDDVSNAMTRMARPGGARRELLQTVCQRFNISYLQLLSKLGRKSHQ
jgi:hypothetical protein